jgi:hypothetical protein
MERGSIPLGPTKLNASETWKSERSYKPFSARLAFLRRFDPFRWYQDMEDDAGGMVRRLALKTRFSEMGWGSTPPSSAKVIESCPSG